MTRCWKFCVIVARPRFKLASPISITLLYFLDFLLLYFTSTFVLVLTGGEMGNFAYTASAADCHELLRRYHSYSGVSPILWKSCTREDISPLHWRVSNITISWKKQKAICFFTHWKRGIWTQDLHLSDAVIRWTGGFSAGHEGMCRWDYLCNLNQSIKLLFLLFLL
jgi:hypothetical protein